MTVTTQWTDPSRLRIHLPSPRVCHCGQIHRVEMGERAFLRQLAQRPYYATVTSTWTDPSEGGTIDRDTGQTIRESDWDAVLSNLKNLGGTAGTISCRVYHTTNQSLSDGAATALAFNSERFDTDTLHDTAVNNTRLTCRTAGKYLIYATIAFAAHATGYRQALLKLNATTYLAIQATLSVGGAAESRLSISTIYDLAVNDFVEVEGYQNSGGALNVLAAGNYSPEFGMAKV